MMASTERPYRVANAAVGSPLATIARDTNTDCRMRLRKRDAIATSVACGAIAAAGLAACDPLSELQHAGVANLLCWLPNPAVGINDPTREGLYV